MSFSNEDYINTYNYQGLTNITNWVISTLYNDIAKRQPHFSSEVTSKPALKPLTDSFRKMVQSTVKDYRERFVGFKMNQKVILEKLEFFAFQSSYESDWMFEQDNLETKKRNLTLLFFLNDLEGAGIEFFYSSKEIKADSCKLAVFPPYWDFPFKIYNRSQAPLFLLKGNTVYL